MNERTLRVLEYNKVAQLLMEEAATSVGRERAKQVKPLVDIKEVNVLQTETDEALQILRLNKAIPFSHITDITESVKRSVIGSTLSTEECLQIAQVLYSSRKIKQFIEGLEEVPLLLEHVAMLTPLQHIEKEVKLKIDEYGKVVDDASAALKSVRSSIRTYEAKIRERLLHLTKTKSKMLSDTIITIRNDRYVLPVKHEYRSAIGGIVHDESSSGQTLFMEPRAIIELNNALQHAYVKEKREIEIILQQLTATIAAFEGDILQNLQVIAKLDFITARSRLAMKMKAAKPVLNDQGIIELKQVRHPLIPREEVVANDIAIGDTYRAIVITGPNTGGKTVTLKTVGLCTLMAQSGLQIPALDGCKLAVFSQVFADIGDEQSIEQNLSTFSSHMTNIVKVMQSVHRDSLVLFDELGAGTDPQEGAALAMSLLDRVIETGACVIATTHYPELKAYGYNKSGVVNASVEFDVETLRPTYRLLMGVPGRSNAFEISARLGLQADIIQHAKSYVGVDSKNVEHMIAALESSRHEAEKKLEEAHALLAESEQLKADLQEEWSVFQAKRAKLFERAEEKAAKALEKAREEAEIIVAEVRQMKDQAQFKEHEWIEAKKMLDEARPTLSAKHKQEAKASEPHTFAIGDEIKHRTLQQQGQIIEKKGKNAFIVQMGMMKITAKKEDLIFIKKATPEKDIETRHTTRVHQSGPSVKSELDLRGVRYEDAMYQLEKYMDDALLQNYPQVTIIHGKGTGALRKGVEQYIKTHPHIQSARLGNQGEGGSGVTVIKFK